MRTSRSISPSLLTVTAAAGLVLTSSSAFAFGGTARELERQGNFAVTNNADIRFTHQLNNPSFSTFALRPALDYFVIDHLSIGGAIELDFDAPAQGPNTTTFRVAPEVGYELALSDTWSFWPQASITVNFPSRGDVTATLFLYAPFLVHPTEHFFFGLGPGFAQDLNSNANTQLIGKFMIGGYFDH